MAQLTLSEGFFFGLIFETFFYSIFLVVLGSSLYLQWERVHDHSSTVTKPVLVFSLVLGVLISVHWALNFWNVYTTFKTLGPGITRELAFGDFSSKRTFTIIVIYEAQIWMGDAILVWRLWLVSGKDLKLVTLPAITCTGFFATSCGFMYACAKSKPTDPASLLPVRDWSNAAFAASIFENVFCASLITWKIWRVQRDVGNAALGSSSRTSIARIFIESAALWTIAMSCTFISYLSGNRVYFVFYYLAAPVLGISFCLMTVRLNLRARSPLVTSLGSGPGLAARVGDSSGSSGYNSGPGGRRVALDPTASLDTGRNGDDSSKIQHGHLQVEERNLS